MATNGTNGYTNGHANGHANGHINGHSVPATNGLAFPTAGTKSHLLPADPDAVQDLICVGFGPASLAVAIALHDALDAGHVAQPAPKVLFLEKQDRFAWHAGMLLPGAKMQISFVKDLATLRDPRSAFTFIHYLHCNNRLVEFTNLSTFLPARSEYEDYLRWCARHFDDAVLYQSEVVDVKRDGPTDGAAAADAAAAVSTFAVTVRQPGGATKVYRARNVLLATGGKPSLPPCLPANHPRVIHSSQYAHLVPKILSDTSAPYRVAVVGAGQSAAEIFNNIQVLYPNSRTSLVMRSEFLKPSDDSPFVNSIFNPEYIDELFPRPAQSRKHLLKDARATNYGVVRLELIEALYERMYHQRRLLGSDETKWPHRIRGNSRVARVDPGEGKTLRLFIEPDDSDAGVTTAAAAGQEELEVDLIVAATGYKRNAHVTMLEDLWPLLPPKSAAGGKAADDADLATGSWEIPNGSPTTSKVLSVARDYRVQFTPGAIADGSGVWLQGCCEGSHGLSDTLLSVLATRSGEIVGSLFGGKQ